MQVSKIGKVGIVSPLKGAVECISWAFIPSGTEMLSRLYMNGRIQFITMGLLAK